MFEYWISIRRTLRQRHMTEQYNTRTISKVQDGMVRILNRLSNHKSQGTSVWMKYCNEGLSDVLV